MVVVICFGMVDDCDVTLFGKVVAFSDVIGPCVEKAVADWDADSKTDICSDVISPLYVEVFSSKFQQKKTFYLTDTGESHIYDTFSFKWLMDRVFILSLFLINQPDNV